MHSIVDLNFLLPRQFLVCLFVIVVFVFNTIGHLTKMWWFRVSICSWQHLITLMLLKHRLVFYRIEKSISRASWTGKWYNIMSKSIGLGIRVLQSNSSFPS